MNDRTLTTMIGFAIGLLLAREIFTSIRDFWGEVYGFASAVIVSVVTAYCGRKARAGATNLGWFLVPTLLFTAVPTASLVQDFFAEQATWSDRIWQWTPFVLGTATPLLLLFAVYLQLRSRS